MPKVVVDMKFLINQLLDIQDKINDLTVSLINACSLVDEEDGDQE